MALAMGWEMALAMALAMVWEVPQESLPWALEQDRAWGRFELRTIHTTNSYPLFH